MGHLRHHTPPKYAIQKAARPSQQYQHLGLYIKGGLDDALAAWLVLHQVGGAGGTADSSPLWRTAASVQATSVARATTSRPSATVRQKGIVPFYVGEAHAEAHSLVLKALRHMIIWCGWNAAATKPRVWPADLRNIRACWDRSP